MCVGVVGREVCSVVEATEGTFYTLRRRSERYMVDMVYLVCDLHSWCVEESNGVFGSVV